MHIVAVTSCPTGVAHTYMAAERLERAAKKLGHTIKVETQGQMGVENALSAADVAAADVALFAADIAVRDRERFSGLRIVEVPVQLAIKDPASIAAAAPIRTDAATANTGTGRITGAAVDAGYPATPLVATISFTFATPPTTFSAGT